jgi:hypothetical protein
MTTRLGLDFDIIGDSALDEARNILSVLRSSDSDGSDSNIQVVALYPVHLIQEISLIADAARSAGAHGVDTGLQGARIVTHLEGEDILRTRTNDSGDEGKKCQTRGSSRN